MKFLLLLVSLGVTSIYCGYNLPLTHTDMHFVNASMLDHITKGEIPKDAYTEVSKEGGNYFLSLGMTFKTQFSSSDKRDYIFMKGDRSERTLVPLTIEQHEKEQSLKDAVVFIKNRRAKSGGRPIPFTIGTGFYISPNIILTNGHVYQDDYNPQSNYATMDKNKKIFFSKQNGQSSGFHHLKIFCSDLDYCLIYAPKIKDSHSFLDFQMKPTLSENVTTTLMGYPGVLFSQFRPARDKFHLAMMASSGKGLFRLVDLIEENPKFMEGPSGETFENWKGSNKYIKDYSYLEKLLIYYTPSYGGTSGGPVLNEDGKVVAVNFFGSNLSTDQKNYTYGYTLGVESTFVVLDIISKCRQKKYLKQKFLQETEKAHVKFIAENFCKEFDSKYLPKKN